MSESENFYQLLIFGLAALLIWWMISVAPPRVQRTLAPTFLITLGFFAYQYVPWRYWFNAIRELFSPVF